jgi:hypothetical protein
MKKDIKEDPNKTIWDIFEMVINENSYASPWMPERGVMVFQEFLSELNKKNLELKKDQVEELLERIKNYLKK